MNGVANRSTRKTAKRKRTPANRQIKRRSAEPRRVADADKALARAPRAALPSFVKPCLATLADKAPDGERWIHEVKFDGYRLQARLDRGKTKLLTRKGLDWTAKFPTIVAAVAKLKANSALIDGELVAEDKDGISRFSLLQQDLKNGRHDRTVLYAFDLIYLDGADLKSLPLVARKAALAKLIGRNQRGALRLSKPLTGPGPALFTKACKMGLEGIVSKQAETPYRSGRGHAWRKVKCSDRQEFVVAGFAPSVADAQAVGALVLGVYARGKLCYAGRTGAGFTHANARALFRKFQAHRRETPPFDHVPNEERGRRQPIWLEPIFVAEVAFAGWTHRDRVRQASFQGLRGDKPAKEVVREVKK